jgi:hypothetical protein
MVANGTSVDLAELCSLLDEAAVWNGGWLNGAAYGRWRSGNRERGRGAPSRQALTARGVDLVTLIRGLGIPTTPPPVSDQDSLVFVSKAHSEVGIDGLSITAYRRWQSAQEKAPTSGALTERFGSWNVILERAGIPIVSGNRRYSDSELMAALRNAARTVDVPLDALTMQLYEEWQRGRRMPTGLTITNRFGSWLKAVGRA